MKTKFILIALLLAGSALRAPAQDDTVMKAMRDELARTMSQLKMDGMDKPYFVAYRVADVNAVEISASLGSLTGSTPMHRRTVKVELRVGDYQLDNTNFMSSRTFGADMFSGIGEAPIDDNYLEIRRQLWMATDRQYKRALQDISAKRSVLQTRRRTEDIPDFSKEQPAKLVEPPHPMRVETAVLEKLARDLSAVFQASPQVTTSSVDVSLLDEYNRYTNSEGSEYAISDPGLTVTIKGQTQAADGLPITDSVSVYGRSLEELKPAELMVRAKALAAKLGELQKASLPERYTGPMLFEGDAAAEIFADIFVPKLLATRLPMTDDPQAEAALNQLAGRMGGSFTDRLGARVLPDFVDVTDAPQMEKFGDSPLMGAYRIDEEAVPVRETKLVENGIVRAVLSSRTPAGKILHSTGSKHGMGAAPSNVLFTAHKTATKEELRAELIKLAKARGNDYGIIVRRANGGVINSFMDMLMRMQSGDMGNTTPLLEVSKYFADGHEEPLRGVELTEASVAAFKDIVAAGDKPVVYTDAYMPKLTSIFSMFAGGGSDSSGLPAVSYVVPSLLFDELSLKEATGPFPNPPLSKPPSAEAQ